MNTVYRSYATPGHALVGARICVPEEQLADTERRASQLAQDILTEMIADATIPPWIAGDEVYGRAGNFALSWPTTRSGT